VVVGGLLCHQVNGEWEMVENRIFPFSRYTSIARKIVRVKRDFHLKKGYLLFFLAHLEGCGTFRQFRLLTH
jgi:hypothetical protein